MKSIKNRPIFLQKKDKTKEFISDSLYFQKWSYFSDKSIDLMKEQISNLPKGKIELDELARIHPNFIESYLKYSIENYLFI